MNTQEELIEKINNASTLLNKAKILLNEIGSTDIIYSKAQNEMRIMKDIALIQCFYGTDVSRIRATTQALEFNLQMTTQPTTWIFVECQKSKDECSFGWLRKYGVSYYFIEMKDENEGIPLKNALWNYGTTLCKESRLCFVDSDVVMCESNWIDKVNDAFSSGYDVLSLASHQYYQLGDGKLYETIGYKWATQHNVKDGHCGFTLGMTRKTFDEFAGFDITLASDDILTFYRICGERIFSPFQKFVKNYKLPQEHSNGYNVKLWYVDTVSCHVWHGDAICKNEQIDKLVNASGIQSYYSIINYDFSKFNILPYWNMNSSISKSLKNVICQFNEEISQSLDDETLNVDLVKDFYNQIKRVNGYPDKEHPLVVCTVIEDGFGVDLSLFSNFKLFVERKFENSMYKPTIVFFTDVKFELNNGDFNIVDLKSFNSNKPYEQCLRDDVKFPQNSVIYYIPFDTNNFNNEIWIPDETIIFNDGTAFIKR